jgi:hypothetical protein
MGTGERKMDTSAVYTMTLPAERVPEVEAILRVFKQSTTQEAIFLQIERNVETKFI